MAVGMALDAAGDERDALGDEQRAGAVLHDLAVALDLGERALELARSWRPTRSRAASSSGGSGAPRRLERARMRPGPGSSSRSRSARLRVAARFFWVFL